MIDQSEKGAHREIAPLSIDTRNSALIQTHVSRIIVPHFTRTRTRTVV
jgi:hypothetical protein